MARGVELSEMHPIFETAFNNHELDGVMALYGPDSTMVQVDGGTIRGTEAIRRSLEVLFGVPGRMALRTRYVIEAGDLALLSCEWSLTAGDEVRSAVSTEVAQRQPEGGWLYLLDHPYGGSDPAEAGNLAEAGASPSS
jgi:ketosteroid isomerase-like protein